MAAITVDKPLPAGWQRDQWYARRDAILMLPHRPRVLLACEWARRILPIYLAYNSADRRPENAIRASRAWVFDPSAEHWQMVRDSANAAYAAAYAAAAVSDAADPAPAPDPAYAAAAAADAAAAVADAADAANPAYAARAANVATYAARTEADLWPWLYRTYQRAIGPEGVIFDPLWRTAEAVGIARGIADTLALDRLPILADALEDAGFSHDATLLAMRDEPDTATLADWPLWGLLGLGAE